MGSGLLRSLGCGKVEELARSSAGLEDGLAVLLADVLVHLPLGASIPGRSP